MLQPHLPSAAVNIRALISSEADRAPCEVRLGSFHPLAGDTEVDGCLVDADIATVARVV